MPDFGVPKDFEIGNMRYLVTLATRQQSPDSTTGIDETFIDTLDVYADIRPLGLQTYIGSEQIETPLTHRITFRWSDQLDMFDVVLREVLRPDGSRRQELYRVRRVTEWEGRMRYTIADCELERRDG